MRKTTNYLVLGIITGILSGLFASGGGLVLVPVLTNKFKVGEKEARAISIFCILPMVLTSMILYKKSGYIDWKTGILCGMGGIAGGVLGSKLLKRINDKYLALTFIIFLIYASITILVQ